MVFFESVIAIRYTLTILLPKDFEKISWLVGISGKSVKASEWFQQNLRSRKIFEYFCFLLEKKLTKRIRLPVIVLHGKNLSSHF